MSKLLIKCKSSGAVVDEVVGENKAELWQTFLETWGKLHYKAVYTMP
jgi:hypothetical protein